MLMAGDSLPENPTTQNQKTAFRFPPILLRACLIHDAGSHEKVSADHPFLLRWSVSDSTLTSKAKTYAHYRYFGTLPIGIAKEQPMITLGKGDIEGADRNMTWGGRREDMGRSITLPTVLPGTVSGTY